jgi:molybdopterin-containing oxidoreductase family iron-sulfur binding subunit
LGIEGNTVQNARQFAEGRRVHQEPAAQAREMNRLYIVESTYTVTGTMADHRLRLPSSMVADYVLALLKELVSHKNVGVPPDLKSAIERATYLGSGIPSEWYVEVVNELLEFKGKSLVIASDRQPPIVHAMAGLINQLLGNVGQTVYYRPAIIEEHKPIDELQRLLVADQVSTLVIVGGNPLYNAPANLAFDQCLKKASTGIA